MFNFGKVTIASKLRHMIITTAEVALLITLIIYCVSDYIKSRESMIEQISNLGIVLGKISVTAIKNDNVRIGSMLLTTLREVDSTLAAYLIKSDNTILAKYEDKKFIKLKNDFERSENEGTSQFVATFHPGKFVVFHDDWVDVSIPVISKDQAIGSVLIRGDLQGLYKQIVWNILIALLITLMAILFSYVAAYRFQRILSIPITRLANSMKKVSSEQTYEVVLENYNDDEIGDLYEQFNVMLKQINDRDIKLSNARIDLEKIVVLRTDALNQANEKLKAMITEAMEAKESALDAAKDKSAFLANMSHEIRTPMNGVLGMLELLKDKDLEDDVRADFLETACVSAEALLTIINDTLDFSKIEAGKMHLEKIDISLTSILEEVTALLVHKATEKMIDLSCYCDVNIPEIVIGDSVRLRQILTNVIGNAVKFTEEGEVVARCLLQSKNDESVFIRFEIIDTGIGIEKDVIPKLFTAFTQSDGSTTRKFGGTGLGLTISKKLVEAMGGEIHIESEMGEGSCFSFEIELLISTTEFEEPVEYQPVSGNVLIVDDNKTNLSIISKYLEFVGLNVEEAESGEEALGKLQKSVKENNQFNLAFIDMNLSDMSGVDLAKAMNASNDIKNVPRIMLTQSGSLSKKELEEYNVSGYILKPYKKKQLLNITRTVLNSDKEGIILVSDNQESDSSSVGKLMNAKILLVEDNVVNRKVALAIMGKIGFTADTAINGRLGVEAWSGNEYDLILMDCQMPEMSGYEATGVIREKEKDTDKHTPIIAMTANVMDGDKEKCLAAGMDDYLSKPIKIELLKSMLKKWLNADLASTVPQKKHQTSVGFENLISDEELEAFTILNDETLEQLKMIMEDEFGDLLDSYLEDSPKLLKDIFNSATEMDSKVFIRAAHTLKSSSQNLGADRLGKLSSVLEVAGRENNITKTSGLLKTTLQALFDTTRELILTYKKENVD